MIRFFVDENLPPKIAEVGRALGIDIVAANELARNGWKDEQQLVVAAGEGRCIVTRDCRDFMRLTSAFLSSGMPHFGVLCISAAVSDREFVRIARALVDYAHAHPDGVTPYLIDYLQVRRIP